MKTFFAYLMVCMTFFSIFIVYGWFNFTQTVQNRVDNSLESYREVAIDWDEIEIRAVMSILDSGESMDIIRSELIEITFSLTYSGDNTRYEYRDSIFDVIYHVAKGSDSEAVKEHMEKADQKQQQWIDNLEKFSNNTLYAMQFTFW